MVSELSEYRDPVTSEEFAEHRERYKRMMIEFLTTGRVLVRFIFFWKIMEVVLW